MCVYVCGIVCDTKHNIDLYCLLFHCKHILWIRINSRKKKNVLSIHVFADWVGSTVECIVLIFFFRLVFFIFFASMNLIFYPCWMSVSVCIVCACACAYAVGNCVNANFFFQYFSHKCFYSAMYCWNDTVKPRRGYKRDRNNVLMSQTNTRTLIEPAMSTMGVVPMLIF